MYTIHAATPQVLMEQVLSVIDVQLSNATRDIDAAKTMRDMHAATRVHQSLKSLRTLLGSAKLVTE